MARIAERFLFMSARVTRKGFPACRVNCSQLWLQENRFISGCPQAITTGLIESQPVFGKSFLHLSP